MAKQIYFLPGRGGKLTSGLGLELAERGFDVQGRELTGDFSKLAFSEQVDMVVADLLSKFSDRDGLVVANSFGAYLFLHAQSRMPGYLGRVLLLSPIVGESSRDSKYANFIPPRVDELSAALSGGNFPVPSSCEIHVGSDDWQSNPANVRDVAKVLNARLTIIEGVGHELGRSYVGGVLDAWCFS